jgi:small subunit ribosomal protein S4
MGDPKRKHKKYSRPRQLFEKARIEEENALIKRYGLKNKREIWKAASEIDRIRSLAKNLIVASQEEQQKFFNRLIKLGLIKSEDNIDDVLALTKEKLLARRLQTIVFKRGLAKTPKGARQLIVHRKIMVGGKVIDAPSYTVKSDEEQTIQIRKKEKKQKQQEKIEPKEEEPEQKEQEQKQEEKTKDG